MIVVGIRMINPTINQNLVTYKETFLETIKRGYNTILFFI